MDIKVSKKEIKQRMKEYISSTDLKFYFGEGFENHIMTYSELQNYSSMAQLLPRNKMFKIILIEIEDDNIGHWVMVSRYQSKGKKVFEYFDSYGLPPSFHLDIMDTNKRIEFDQFEKHLNVLLRKEIKRNTVLYNKLQFQSYNKGIATCGRHVVLRAIMLKHFDLDLCCYIQFMKNMEQETGMDYDEIVSVFIK